MLIMSDLHVIVDENYAKDSNFLYKGDHSDFGSKLLDYLSKNIDRNEIDLLVCPGDISNRADEVAFKKGWEFLKKVQEDLAIPRLLCVPGNHDHKSRKVKSRKGKSRKGKSSVGDQLSPKHGLQFMEPAFPVDDFCDRSHFWAWNWLHVDNNNYDVVMLNTSAYHGYKDGEDSRGRIAIETCNQIGEQVSKISNNKDFSILLCHHAPYKMEHVYAGEDNQEIQGAQNLIHVLETSNDFPWLVIHGHKHFVEVRYALSKKNSPTTLFSAGSLSAKSYTPAYVNQFHILKINLEECRRLGRVVGIFQTHTKKPGRDWELDQGDISSPSGGFGGNVAIPEVANEILNAVNSDAAKFLEADELDSFNEKIEYCTNEDLKTLVKRLKRLGLEIFTTNNKITQVAVKK